MRGRGGRQAQRWDVLSWMGGSGAIAKTNWHCLEGRHVTLWPDADDNETGLKAMPKLAGIAEARAASVRMIKPEPERNKEDEVTGWDVADAIKKGIDVADYIEADYIELGEPESDPLDNLIEKAKTDLGAAFEPDVLARLVEMKRNDLAGYARIRKKLKEAGVYMAMLDEALKPQGGRDGDDLQGSGIEWPTVEPWPDAVSGASLLDEISGLISQYLYLPKPMAARG